MGVAVLIGEVTAQEVLEEVPQQRVIAEPVTLRSQCGDELVATLEPLEHGLAVVARDDRPREVRRDRVAHTGAQQEVPIGRCAAIQHLGEQVLGH